ncbi:transposase [Caldifermentibacillus hisashii]|jgi:transposase|uniref:transposase n=1 Tax=Caldifermentibacillus hisashii TaxID=996558 RepID=UPI00310163B5
MAKLKTYDEDFKKQTVKYIMEEAKPVAQVARELKINANTIHGWIKKYNQEPEIKKAQTFRSEDHEMRELRKRIRVLEEENSILKKAMHFFAKDHR